MIKGDGIVMSHKTGCLICGGEIKYGEAQKLECFYCHETYESNAECEEGHFVCDKCHSLAGAELIEKFCTATELKDPLEIAQTLMRNPTIKMHGPEHHFLVPASLIAAYYNSIGDSKPKAAKIGEAKKRAANVLGGFCGFYGDCGAAVGTGIFISVVTGSTPLSTNEWRLSNLMTSKSLRTIADHGGPRCCKRNTYLAIREAAKFAKTQFGVTIKAGNKLRCEFSSLNKECLRQACPYYPGEASS